MQFSTVITHARNEYGKFAEAHARNDLTKPPFYALLLLPFRAFVGRSTTLLLSCCYFSVAFRGSSVAMPRKGGNNCSTYVVPIFTIYPCFFGANSTERGLYTRTYLVLIWGRSPGAYRCNTTANDRARYGFVNLIVRSGSSCLRRVSL